MKVTKAQETFFTLCFLLHLINALTCSLGLLCRKPSPALINRNITAQNTPNGKYNMLAQLLSDDPHIPIRFAVFNGKDKASTMYAVREYGNMCVLMSLDKVLDFGDTLNVP